MTAWLPEDAIDSQKLVPLLLEVLEQWRADWLTGGEILASPVYQDNCPILPASMQWRSTGGIALAWREGMQWALASDLTGHKVLAASLQPTDRSLLQSLVGAAVDALLCLLADRFGDMDKGHVVGSSPADLDSSAWWEISLAPGKPVLKLAIPRARLARAVLSTMPKAEPLALKPLRNGLAQQEVAVAAELGRCRLSLADLKGLGIGDVLVLDKDASDPVTLSVNGRPAPIRASVAAADDGALLTIFAKEKSHA